MKLRIRGNSVRFRMTQSEVARLRSGETIRESVTFPGQNLLYSIAPVESASRISVSYRDGEISVLAPAERVRIWAEAEEVGMEGAESLVEGGTLHILVEKDFRCLQPRSDEDERDNFPHPLEAAPPGNSCEG